MPFTFSKQIVNESKSSATLAAKPPIDKRQCVGAAIRNMVQTHRLRVVFTGHDDDTRAGAQPLRVRVFGGELR